MNHRTSVQLAADPNGDLTLTNEDGTITIRADGTVSISTVAPIELCGASLGKLDTTATAGTSLAANVKGFLNLLLNRGKRD